jgi:hypothetical protein
MQIAILVAVLCAAPQLPTGVTASADKQPVPLYMRAIAGEPRRPASGWALTPTGELPAAGSVLTAQGLGVRIRSATEVTVFRPEWMLAGSFGVGALFQSSQPDATYGLTLGGAKGLAFLVRNNGTFAIASKSTTGVTGATWAPVQFRAAADNASGANRLEVRTTATEVRFMINGQTVRTMPIAAGQLDGSPGVYVGAAGDVNVAGFTIEGASVLPTRTVK